jgi:hypothetical protein
MRKPMTITPEMLTKAILDVRDELLSSGQYATAAAINSGYCTDFADDVFERFGRDAHDCLDQLGIDNFMKPAADDVFNNGYPMDRELLLAYWPEVVPTQGMSWEDLDRLSADADFGAGTHVWIHLGKKFYDAEAPEGVDNFFELPFFQRVISSWIEAEAPHIRAGMAV